MRAIRISNTMTEIQLSEDLVEAIRRIAKVDFNSTECVSSAMLGRIHERLKNFRSMRSQVEFSRYMEFYRLFELQDGREFENLVIALENLVDRKKKTGLSVSITE